MLHNEDMAESKQLNIGRAGQFLVLADLLLAGYSAFPTGEGMNYDLIVAINGRFCRLQVKTTQELKHWTRKKLKRPDSPLVKANLSPVYHFNARRAGKYGRREYGLDEFDGFALVTLDTRHIFYLPFVHQIKGAVSFRTKAYTGYSGFGRCNPYIENFTLDSFIQWFAAPTKVEVWNKAKSIAL